MRPLTRHLTPDELRILWILTAVVLMGIGGRIWIASHPGTSAATATHAPAP